MKLRIESIQAWKLVGIRQHMSLAENQTAQLWRSFMPRRHEIMNRTSSEYISMQVYSATGGQLFSPTTVFEKWAAVEVWRMTLFRTVWKAALCLAVNMQSLFTTVPQARRRRLCGIYSETGFLIQGTNWTTRSILKYCPRAMTRLTSMHTKKSGFLSGDSVRNIRVAN